MTITFLAKFFLWLISPLIGGLIEGIERKLRARMQNRIGPSIFQPFYDFLKLLNKRSFMVHSTHALLGLLHLLGVWISFGVLLLGGDLLLVIYLHLFATGFLVMAGFTARSVFSHMGAQRLALATLAYEPILIFIAIGFYLSTGSFSVTTVFDANQVLLKNHFLAFLALFLVLPIKLRKSPFDVVTAHQEIVGGAEIEFSGIFYEALYTAKWIEILFAYTLVWLFAASLPWLAVTLILSTFLLLNLIDNATGRVSYKQMLRFALGCAFPLAVLNLVFQLL